MITVDFKRLKIRPGFRKQDIGCGTGRHTSAASRFDHVVTVGSDINFDDVLETRRRLNFEKEVEEQGDNTWGAIVADIYHLPFKTNSFDVVICSEVLEHIQDQERAVQEVVRVVRPGRDLVVSVPRYFPERICWALSEDYHSASNGHVRIYRKKELTDLLEEAGTRKWAAHFAHSLHTPYWWLKCLVGPSRDDSRLVSLYHGFLVWEMMNSSWITRLLDNLLNPILGKSIVFYLRKENAQSRNFSERTACAC
jgi:SAM-dependent methyltransferase